MATNEKEIRENLGVTAGHRWRRWTGWLIAVVVVGAGGLALKNEVKASAAAPMVSYRTQPAQRGSLTVAVRATGQLQPTKTVEVGSEVSGIIDSVEVDYNDQVKVGQVLAKINIDKFQQQVSQSKASLDSARAKVQDAQVTVLETERKYNRIVDARARSHNQLPSQQDLETAQANYERAKVAVTTAQAAATQAEATLAVDQTNLSKTVIRSPVNGVVLARKVEPGQTIAASFSVTTMFQLAEDLGNMKLEVNIDEADVGHVKAGQEATFTVDAYPGRRFPGTITQLRYQSTTTNNVVTYLAVISVNNRDRLLRPGMTATAEITVLSVKDSLLAPNVALRFKPVTASNAEADQRSFFRKLMPGPPPMTAKVVEAEDNSGPRVWVLREGKPVPVAVKTGATNGKVTQILSGEITPGAELVVDTMKGAR
jgi:HlyD family secretion protein